MSKNVHRMVLFMFSASLVLALFGCMKPGISSALATADLTVTSITAPSAPVARTDTWSIGAVVENIGTSLAGASVLRYRLSTDAVLDSADPVLATSNIPALDAGQSWTDSVPGSFSVAAEDNQQGPHYIFAEADATSVVAESNEGNNTASVPLEVIYDEVFIETYGPTDAITLIPTWPTLYDYIDLFGPAGDNSATSYNLWSSNQDQSVALAWSNGSNFIDLQAYQFAMIDYKGALAPGTYYLRIRGYTSTTTGPYALRVLTSVADVAAPWFFTSENASDAPYESDDNPTAGGGGVPTNPASITVGGKLNRYITAGDVDWVRITLP
jgi:hypothetical protein